MPKKFAQPLVVISKCLVGAACRWDGDSIDEPFPRALKRWVKFKPVCPEIEIGLGVPRDRIIIVTNGNRRRLIQPSHKLDLTERMNNFSQNFLDGIGDVDGFLLKAKSPSCGLRDTKQFFGTNKHSRLADRSSGLFGEQIAKRFGHIPVEDERRLLDANSREQWLTRLFCLAALRHAKAKQSLPVLRAFHEYNMLLLGVRSKRAYAAMDRLMRQSHNLSPAALFDQYAELATSCLAQPVRRKSVCEALQEALAHYSPYLSASDKQKFKASLKQYANGQIILGSLLKVVQVWGVRYDKEFIRTQSFYRPFPGELLG